MSDTDERRRAIEAWVQRQDEELLYTPDGVAASALWTCPQCSYHTNDLRTAAAHYAAHTGIVTPEACGLSDAWHYGDKTAWPPGPWQAEPDGAVWTDAASGLQCLAWRNRLGTWNGSVVLPARHPLHGADDLDLPPLRVHGGLEFSGACGELDPLASVCAHLHPSDSEAHAWCLGFDCGHGYDLSPGYRRDLYDHQVASGIPYRALPYVQAQCAQLAAQVVELGMVDGEEDAAVEEPRP